MLLILCTSNYNRKRISHEKLAEFGKHERRLTRLTQEDLTATARVTPTSIRKIEQNKGNLNLEKLNQVLRIFGDELAPVN